ncbi:T9SS type A sorting domain-containing protein [Flavobacterium subsaxonicum]|uniref:Secretion system C-terminal sorting domain-containing protein n=1 Tax=Flavobacterium subsaxonicum WB 4.1-42 = DSM 21790 TaxID=1121898 RepID=A0A0A2MIG1_9FLAO|nr:T9SS type A sorting domain-containing protein [Flavobacterium subsaxonicum]KGO92084.1 hypothetical protein Q766_14420 [Flavobacterium subsaxonicum WB 4.1-42 = DSM 21790]
MKFNITLFSVLFITVLGTAQVTNQGKPISWKFTQQQSVAAYNMPAIDVAVLQQQDLVAAKQKETQWRFAYEFNVSYNLDNSGTWYTMPNGDRVWRINITSAQAKTLHFWFRNFYIPPGASLYVYNANHTDLLGAYTSKQNSSGPYFGTWPVSGESVFIEYFEPKAQAGQGKLEIFKVGHGYRELYGADKTGQEVLSGDCNYDVECFVEGIDNLKDISKKSVTRMLGSTGDGAFLATGALINNTANDGTPYVLSANHAWSETAMYTFRFNWINPVPACPSFLDGDGSINEVQTVSGAILRARREESDFMLLEITSDIPTEWGTVWAGWDRSETTSPFTYCVHHPAGDIMKVCRDLDAPTLLDTEEGEFVWDVQSWDLGVTEGGSSGSPLLDNHGRIIGQLWRGVSGCEGNQSNGGGDQYGRLGKSWDTGATADARLKEWLDPNNTGVTVVDAYPAQQIYAVDAKVVLYELGHAECAANAAPVIRLVNYGTQNLTSVQIQYSINDATPSVLNWTGNLAENASTFVDLPELTGVLGNNTVTITITNPNGATDGNVTNNTATADFIVNQSYTITDVTLNLLADNYGEEISWVLTNQNGDVLYSVDQDTYEDGESYSQVFNLTNAGCYTFAIHDGYGDGICCGQGQGSYSLTTADGEVIIAGGEYGQGESVSFKLEAPLGINQFNTFAAIKVYPNPSAGQFTVQVPSGYSPEYKVYNLLGQEVTAGMLASGNGTVNLSAAANGVYLLKVADKATGAVGTFKLVKE